MTAGKQRLPLMAQVQQLQVELQEQMRELTELKQQVDLSKCSVKIESIDLKLTGLRIRVFGNGMSGGSGSTISLDKPELERVPLQRATLAIDWLPGSRLRKKLRKLIADEQQEIIELQAAKRIGCSRWRGWCVSGT
jgi:hypothetical protein